MNTLIDVLHHKNERRGEAKENKVKEHVYEEIEAGKAEKNEEQV